MVLLQNNHLMCLIVQEMQLLLWILNSKLGRSRIKLCFPWLILLCHHRFSHLLVSLVQEKFGVLWNKGSRANILNLKLELQSHKKGNDFVNNFLQKIKIARDKLLVVGVVMDNEELICIVLRGIPREFAHFWSAIWTRSDPITYDRLAIMLQSEEQAIAKHLDSVLHSLAMFASNSKASSSSQNQS